MAKKQYLDLAGLTTYNDEIQSQLNNKADSSHKHSASNITSGTLPIERGGTGNGNGYIQIGAVSGSTVGALATAEGRRVTASGSYSHAEGNYTEASGSSAHAEGQSSTASGIASHAEGNNATASGNYSHAEGDFTNASAKGAHVEGNYTLASSDYQHVQGKFNIEDKAGTYAHIVGNGTGTSSSARSNAHTLDWNGNAWFQGDVYVGSTSGTNKDEGSKRLVTIDDIADASKITSGTLSSDRLSIVPVAKGGTGTGFSLIESIDLQANPRVLLLKEDANGSRYFDAYSSLPVSLGGLGTRMVGNAQDNSLLVKQTDGNGNSFIDYTAHPKVESIAVGNCTINYDDDTKFLEFIFTSTTDTGTEG